MKKLHLLLIAALGALSVISCNKEIEESNTDNNQIQKEAIRFKAVADTPTRATLTDDYAENKVFKAAWEPTDVISVDYGNDGYRYANWNADDKYFVGSDLIAKNDLYAYYPDTKDGLYPFGGAREQDGNKYNSYYDLMYSDEFDLKDGDNDIVVPMHRATAIQYFHLTADSNADWASKKVLSATLTVAGEEANIAAESVMYNSSEIISDGEQKSITITFAEGTAPAASDAQIWFNVLPCTVESMTISVELEDGYTWTKTNNFGGAGYTFEAGKLGYVNGAPTYKKTVEEASMGKGTNADEATVNEKYAIKVGTSSKTGDMTITVGAGATSLCFYAAAWKGASNKNLTISPAAKVSTSSVAIIADDGIANNSPFTLVGEEDSYKITLGLNNITEETTFTLTSNVRFVVWGATYSNGEALTPPSPKEYTIAIADGIVGGTVTANAEKAESGTEITLTATPDAGYEFESWNVTNATTSTTITISSDNKFTMPEANVTVSASFNAISTRPENEIFYESFDTNNGTGGNDNQWSGTIASSDIKQDNDGWTYEKANGASTCAKFGTGSSLGSATTPALGTSCDATLSFKAAAWNTKDEKTTLKLSVIGGGFVSPANITMKRGEWDTFTVTLTALTKSSKIKFEGNSALNSRFFLDEVSIVKTGEATATYTVTIDNNISNGSVSANPTTTIEGETVTLTATPDDGFEFDSWSVSGATVADETSETTTFTMPAADVSVSATFKAIVVPEKTISEFIAAEGGNCYLTGIVGDIEDATYGNFDLRDETGTIYVYGCLTSEGVGKQFNTLGVEFGDKIKVLASEYALFNNIKEAKNVVFVEIVKKATKYDVNVASGITNGTVKVDPIHAAEGQTVTITATPATGYEFESWNVTGATVADATSATTTFTMPASHVNVSATFKKKTIGTITFGTNNVKINAASVTGDDDLGNSWTITTDGTTSFTPQPTYCQVGSNSKSATSITFTTTLPSEVKVTKMSAKFGGFSGTAGTVNLNVGETTIGTGSLNATNDVTVNSTSTVNGTVLKVTVTNIAKGVKVYNISYTYETI